MKWYYIESVQRRGPFDDAEWAEQVRAGVIRPETLVWHEGMGERWVPFAQLPPIEPPALPETQDKSPEAPLMFAQRVADRDYMVKIGKHVAEAWDVFLVHFVPLVAATFCTVALFLIFKFVLPILGIILSSVILGGFYILCLRLMRGQSAGIGDLWEGFSAPLLKPLMFHSLIVSLVWLVCYDIPVNYTLKSMGITHETIQAALDTGSLESMANLFDPQMALVFLLVVLACLTPVIYFSFCWIFSIPLIVDKGMPFWPAMKLSRHKVLQHPWRVSVLLVAAGLVGSMGVFFFFFGIFLTLPLYFLIVLRLYETIFNHEKPQ